MIKMRSADDNFLSWKDFFAFKKNGPKFQRKSFFSSNDQISSFASEILIFDPMNEISYELKDFLVQWF